MTGDAKEFPNKVVSLEEHEADIFKKFKDLWRYGHPMFYEIVIEMCKIHEIKNKSYGIGNPLGNFMESERLRIPAWKGALVRITDKYSRVCNLATKINDTDYADALEMESLEDTLLDLANYSILCLVLFRDAKKRRILGKILNEKENQNKCCVEEASF